MSPHGFSAICQEEGVTFVMEVNKILNPDSKAAEEFDKTQVMPCPSQKRAEKGTPEEAAQNNAQADPEKEKELRQAMEDKMLCEVMCCCDRHPAKSSNPNTKRNLHQTCVKDIFDRVNGIRDDKYKRHEHLPNSRYAAELSINTGKNNKSGNNVSAYVGRGIMNPKGPKKNSGERLVRPDMAMLSDNFAQNGDIKIDDIERFVEMKFPTEEGDIAETVKQIFEYHEFGRPVHLMQRCENNSTENMFIDEAFEVYKEKEIKKIKEKYEKNTTGNSNTEEIKNKEISSLENTSYIKKKKIIQEELKIELKCCNCLKGQAAKAGARQANLVVDTPASESAGNPAKEAKKAIDEVKSKLSDFETKHDEAEQQIQEMKNLAQSAQSASSKLAQQYQKNYSELQKCLDETFGAALAAEAAFGQAEKELEKVNKALQKAATQDKASQEKIKTELEKTLEGLKSKFNKNGVPMQNIAKLRFNAAINMTKFLSKSKHLP